MNRSDSIKELATALNKAQGEFQHARKETKNEYFKSNYADLASCIDAAKKPLADNGLSVSQIIDITDDGHMILETILMHTSGEFLSGRSYLNPLKNDPQSFGSVCSYFRRYAFSAITGIAADDDDGNSASGTTNAIQPAAKQAPTIDYFALIEDAKTLDDLSKVWKSIPANLKPTYAKIKDAQKEVINSPDVSNYPSTEVN
jgi:hypothetical protein